MYIWTVNFFLVTILLANPRNFPNQRLFKLKYSFVKSLEQKIILLPGKSFIVLIRNKLLILFRIKDFTVITYY